MACSSSVPTDPAEISVGDSKVLINFVNALQTPATPAGSEFVVRFDGNLYPVLTTSTPDANTLQLNLDAPVISPGDDGVTFTPTENDLNGADGLPVCAFTTGLTEV